MKKWVLFTAALILFFSWAAAQDDTYYDNSYARMSYVSGDTYVQRAQDLGYEAGSVNLAVISGDALGTREGRLEIHFGQQNYLRMDRHSQMDVTQLPSRNLDYRAAYPGRLLLCPGGRAVQDTHGAGRGDGIEGHRGFHRGGR